MEQVPTSARLLNDSFDVIYRREHPFCSTQHLAAFNIVSASLAARLDLYRSLI